MEATKTTCHDVVSAEIHAGAVPIAYRSATKTDSFGNVLPCGPHWKHQNERHIVSNIRIHEDIWDMYIRTNMKIRGMLV